jgi:Focal adhesion targeting region
VNHSMAELVNTMRLAQQYSGTVVAGEYGRAMLAAARTLAVNAKQLLDVIEAVRASATDFTLQRSPPDGASNNVQSPELLFVDQDLRLQSDCVKIEGVAMPGECRGALSDVQPSSGQRQAGASSTADSGFDMNSLLVNSDDEYDDEKFGEDDVAANPDVDLLSSEADRCLEAVEQTNGSDHDDDDENEDDIIDDDAMDLLASALKNLR